MSPGTDDPRRPDDGPEELERLLRDGDAERADPPAGLLDRLLDDLPERLDVAPEILAEGEASGPGDSLNDGQNDGPDADATPDVDAEPVADRPAGARPRRRWLAAATVILALGAGAVALQLVRETPSPTPPELQERPGAAEKARSTARPDSRDRETGSAFEDRAGPEESRQDRAEGTVPDSAPPAALLEPASEPPPGIAAETVPEPAPEAATTDPSAPRQRLDDRAARTRGTEGSDEIDEFRAEEPPPEPARNRSAEGPAETQTEAKAGRRQAPADQAVRAEDAAGDALRAQEDVPVQGRPAQSRLEEVETLEEPLASETAIDAAPLVVVDADAVPPGVAVRLDRLAVAADAEAAWAALGERLEAGLLPTPGSLPAGRLVAAVLGARVDGEDLLLAAAPLPDDLRPLLAPASPEPPGDPGEIVLLALALGDGPEARASASRASASRTPASRRLVLDPAGVEAGRRVAAGTGLFLLRPVAAPTAGSVTPLVRIGTVGDVRSLTRGAVAPRFDDAAPALRLAVVAAAAARRLDPAGDDGLRIDGVRAEAGNAARSADLAALASRARAVAAELEAARDPGADRARELGRRLERAATLLGPGAGP